MKRNNFGTTGLSLAIVSIVLDFISDMLKIEIPYVTIPIILLGLVFLLIAFYDMIKGRKKQLECSKLEAPIPEQSSYVGVPAPILNPVDDWFSSPYGFFYSAITERQKDYMERETEMKRQEQEKNSSVEPEDIHQKMYEIATQNNSINIDHGWQSGTGRFQ